MKGVYECEIITQTEVGPGVIKALLKGPNIAREAKPGQFVNVRVTANTDPLLRRPFSIHAVYPEEGIFSLLYVLKGKGTVLLKNMRVGDRLSVVGPLGTSFDLGDSAGAKHILVAGGCGAAPLHFLCDALCDKWSCDSITVLAGAQCKDAVLCEAEFLSHGVEVAISTDDGSYGYHGFVTQLLQESLSKIKDASDVRVYSCGPHIMMREVARISREAGVRKCQVSLENNMSCGFGVCMGCAQKIKGKAACDKSGANWHYERVCKDGPVFDAEDVVWE